MANETSYEQFLKRYESLKALYFSPKSNPQYDDDGEELPSAFMSKTQITRIFLEEMKCHVPSHRQDPPKFLDGRVGPTWADLMAQKQQAAPVPTEPVAYGEAERREAEKLIAASQGAVPPLPESLL
jgi:uncharacterized protein (DUF1800 family)